MSPSVPGILPREVLAGGIEIDGQHFPAGVDVGVPIYAIQHHDAYYPRPWEFIPERWLVVDETLDRQSESLGADSDPDPIRQLRTPESVELAKNVFCAFSLGPWACVGKSMAYRELTIVLARLVWLYEMRLSPGQLGINEKNEYQGLDMFVMKGNGPIVEFRPRVRAWENEMNWGKGGEGLICDARRCDKMVMLVRFQPKKKKKPDSDPKSDWNSNRLRKDETR